LLHVITVLLLLLLQRELAGMMADQAYESAYEDLGAAMLAAGFKGSIALGIASLLSIDILSNFRCVDHL
jgi:hypothetical protein